MSVASSSAQRAAAHGRSLLRPNGWIKDRLLFRLLRIQAVLVLSCCILALSACASPAHKATYRVSGPAGENALVRYRIPGGEEKQENVALPWEYQVSYTTGQFLEITADSTSRAGNISCAISLPDHEPSSVTSEGIDQAVCSVTP